MTFMIHNHLLITSAIASTAPSRIANSAMNVVAKSPKKGSLFLVTRANGFSIGITSSLAIDWRSRGALHKHWRAAPMIVCACIDNSPWKWFIFTKSGQEWSNDNHPRRWPSKALKQLVQYLLMKTLKNNLLLQRDFPPDSCHFYLATRGLWLPIQIARQGRSRSPM